VSDSTTESPAIDAIRERNVDAVRRFYQCDRDRDLDGWVALWNPKGRCVFPACGFLDPIEGIDDLKANWAVKYETRGKVEIRDEILPLVDPSRVLARVGLSIEVAPGDPPFESEIWVLYTFDRAGLIVQHEEMFDTANYRDILSRPSTPALPSNLRPGSLPGVA
jgi:SnoaL-like domain